MKSVTN